VNHGPRRLPRLPPGPVGPPAGAPDADLLARFALDRDEAAFELLLRRHGPMVLGVCRRVLADPNDADDAFQAVFLVLARKAGSIARAEVVAAWLHRVARRAALRVRAARLKQTGRTAPGVEVVPAPPERDSHLGELWRVLDEEVGLLPARHRTAFVLCCLEGKTGEEAARLLGCPPGTVSSRLTRARERLRDRLARRGFAPAVVAAALTGDALAAVLPARLVDAALTAALPFAAGPLTAGPPARPAAVAEGVLRAMTLTKIRLTALLFLVTGLLAAGAALAGSAIADPDQPPKNPFRQKAADGVKATAGEEERTTQHDCSAEAAQQADLYPQVAGSLLLVNVDLGDRVKKGDYLAEVDAPELKLDVEQAQVGVQGAKALYREAAAKLDGAKAEVATAEASVRLAEVAAKAATATADARKKQRDRMKEVARTGTITQKVLDEAEDSYRSAQDSADAKAAAVDGAKAAVLVAKAKVMQAQAAVASAVNNTEAAQLGLKKARLVVTRTLVVAPFDGVVTRRAAARGDTVRPDARTPLFTVMRVDVLRMVVHVPDRLVPLVKPGVPAAVTFDALPGVTLPAEVSRVGFAEDPKTATMRAEIDVPNPDGRLRPGMTGTAVLKLGKAPAEAPEPGKK
jgi:RNA polymerase sigma factor (sigma-70 family)